MTSTDISRLVETVAEGMRVWVRRGEVALTEGQILERSRNVVDAIRSGFMVVPLPDVPIQIIADPGMPPNEFELRSGRAAVRGRFADMPEAPLPAMTIREWATWPKVRQ